MPPDFAQSDYRDIFFNSVAPMLIVDVNAPHFTILDVNKAYLDVTHTTREALIGKPVFGVFPANPTDNVSKNIERTVGSFQHAINRKVPHIMSNYRYDIPIPGTDQFEENYWTTSNTPVMDAKGKVIYFIHSPLNVTQLYKLEESERAAVNAMQQQRENLYSTFIQAPVGIGIFKGKDFVVEFINPSLCTIYGKTREELEGRPIFDVLERASNMGYEELLSGVMKTGEAFKGSGYRVPLIRNGQLENVFLNFVYEPFHESDGNITGVIAMATEVTDLVNARNQFEEAELRTRLAIDAVEMGTFDIDLSTQEMVSSLQFARIFGFEKPSSWKEYLKVIHPDDLNIRKEAHQEAMATGKMFYEARIKWKDGSYRYVRIEGKVIFNDNNKPARLLGILLDITDQRNSKEEQRKLITLVENSVDFMAVLNLDGRCSFINKAGMDLFGFENEWQISSISVARLYQDPRYFEEEVLPAVIETGRWSGNMKVIHLTTGVVFDVFKNCFRIDDPETGEPIAIGEVMRDLRPEFAAKKALADSELLLRNITTAAPTALWMSDEHGMVNYVNKTWLEWNGNTLEDNEGTGWLSNVHEDDAERTGQTFHSKHVDKTFYEVEFRLNHADGTIHWCIASGYPQFRDDGSFTGFIGACMDVTELKHLQHQKDDFIAIASHELKTPVTSIKGYAQVIEKMLFKKGDLIEAQMMQRINAQIKRLTSLIGDLLDVTNINSGKLQFNNTEFEFNPLVKDLMEDLQRTTEKHTLVADFNPAGFVFGDKDRISQVITNLVTNAIKYSPESDKIIIHTNSNDNEVSICVEDYGIGIEPDKLDKVFEQFYRVSGDMQHTFPGLGLGLYICSEIVKREGGRIWVNSVPGKGSTFCFALPLLRKN